MQPSEVMHTSLVLALVWLVAANLIGAVPSKRHHWPQAWALIAVGLPLLVWVAVSNPWWATAGVLLAACSILRWPVRYAGRWIARRLGLRAA